MLHPGDVGWAWLKERYSPLRDCFPLNRIIELCGQGEHNIQSVLIEPRYADPDFRDEHSRFWHGTFRPYPTTCERVHLFSKRLEDLNLGQYADAYKGYVVMRPLPSAPVGRTMIAPPRDLSDALATVCLATDEVHPLGYTLRIKAMPFVSQDGQYLRCAHAAQYMVLMHAHLTRGMPRRLPGDIHDASMGGFVVGRQMPSDGLSVQQMMCSLDTLGMASNRLGLPHTPSVRLYRQIFRYVNSGLPPIVTSDSHAWVIVGYRSSADETLTLYRHDDGHGPYLPVDDPWKEEKEEHNPWDLMITAVPPRVYLGAERAEWIGGKWLERRQDPLLLECALRGDLRIKTFLIRSNTFKDGLRGRWDTELVDSFVSVPLPGYVWVVEAYDRTLPRDRRVLAEAIIDTTADHLSRPDDPDRLPLLALHIGNKIIMDDVAYGVVSEISAARPFTPFRTSCPSANL